MTATGNPRGRARSGAEIGARAQLLATLTLYWAIGTISSSMLPRRW
jgi:hypothetical protein